MPYIRRQLSWRFLRHISSVAIALTLCSSCDTQELPEEMAEYLFVGLPLGLFSNPYAEVDWATDVRLKAQHHDHVSNRPEVLLAYDRAGYDVVSLLDYSGNPAMSYAWRERIWPPKRFMPTWALDSLVNVKILLPNAEEIGGPVHMTSPFLTTYIEGAQAGAPKAHWQYRSVEEAFTTIRGFGGIPCIAHPWTVFYEKLGGTFCVEIYTAFAPGSAYLKVPWFEGRDPHELVNKWDDALQYNQQIWGIAVNDHFGPQQRGAFPEEIIDSGKILVLSKEATLVAYRDAFMRGAFFAIEDRGSLKDLYPEVFSIGATSHSIVIESTGTVAWKSHGRIVGDGPVLTIANLPAKSRYVRAEISNDEGVVYTQPFSLRPLGDVNGDFVVDGVDAEMCEGFRASGRSEGLRLC